LEIKLPDGLIKMSELMEALKYYRDKAIVVSGNIRKYKDLTSVEDNLDFTWACGTTLVEDELKGKFVSTNYQALLDQYRSVPVYANTTDAFEAPISTGLEHTGENVFAYDLSSILIMDTDVNGFSNVKFKHVEIRTVTTKTYKWANCQGMSMYFCKIVNEMAVSSGVNIYGCVNFTISGCYHEARLGGQYVYAGSTINVNIQKCVFDDYGDPTSRDGLDLAKSDRVVVDSCIFFDSNNCIKLELSEMIYIGSIKAIDCDRLIEFQDGGNINVSEYPWAKAVRLELVNTTKLIHEVEVGTITRRSIIAPSATIVLGGGAFGDYTNLQNDLVNNTHIQIGAGVLTVITS